MKANEERNGEDKVLMIWVVLTNTWGCAISLESNHTKLKWSVEMIGAMLID